MTTYDRNFFTYINDGAFKSAKRLLPVIMRDFEIHSVLDVGCGQGAWLSIWSNLGVNDITGIDGDYVDTSHLFIPDSTFIPYNLSVEFNFGRKFDLVQSLEVAEHLPESSADDYIRSLVKHGDLILFSAATKGQGGNGHINEQNYDYWRGKFKKHNYIAIDYIRPQIKDDKNIEPWYRYNTILYVSNSYYNDLPDKIKKCTVQEDEKIPDISPLTYKTRKQIIKLVPISVITFFTKLRERTVSRK